MAMQPLLQAGLSTGVGLKKADSSFTASDLQTPSPAERLEVCRLTRFGASAEVNLGGLRGKAERVRPEDPPYSTRREPRRPPSFNG